MSIDKNIQIKTYNGTDWDNLFPKTKSDVVMMNDGTTLTQKITDLLNTIGGKATLTDVNNAISNLINSAPSTLDTLKELADALGDDPNFATTITTQLSNKVDKVAGKGLSTNDFDNNYKAKLDGLSNIHTSDSAPTNPINGQLWFSII